MRLFTGLTWTGGTTLRTPPPYSTYTLLSLKHTFFAAAALLVLHILTIIVVKILTSPEFRGRGHYTNKMIHALESTNFATPYADWDEGDHTIQEFRDRFSATCKEMIATFSVNIIVTGIMMIPLWHTGD